MGTTTALRREIRSRFIPYVLKAGFQLDESQAPTFWIFRCATGSVVRVFSIQWEKYGRPRFRLDFGTCPADGLNVRGQHFDWPTVHPHWLPDAATLKPSGRLFIGDWFRQDGSLLTRLVGEARRRQPSEVIDELLVAFADVEAYWSSGTFGKRIRRWRRQ